MISIIYEFELFLMKFVDIVLRRGWLDVVLVLFRWRRFFRLREKIVQI